MAYQRCSKCGNNGYAPQGVCDVCAPSVRKRGSVAFCEYFPMSANGGFQIYVNECDRYGNFVNGYYLKDKTYPTEESCRIACRMRAAKDRYRRECARALFSEHVGGWL